RHTRFSRDWSSDVCSSDLAIGRAPSLPQHRRGIGIRRVAFHERFLRGLLQYQLALRVVAEVDAIEDEERRTLSRAEPLSSYALAVCGVLGKGLCELGGYTPVTSDVVQYGHPQGDEQQPGGDQAAGRQHCAAPESGGLGVYAPGDQRH